MKPTNSIHMTNTDQYIAQKEMQASCREKKLLCSKLHYYAIL